MESTPRKLTTHQKTVLIQVLLSFPEQRVGIWYSSLADDSFSYAQDFLMIFKAIGWRVDDAQPAKMRASPSGVAIVLRGEEAVPPSAEAFRDALRIYGIEAEIFHERDRDIESGSFILAIS
jgi:hypothetical protein